MKPSIPNSQTDDAPAYAMHDLTKSEVELVELSRKVAEHRRSALLDEAQRRRDEQIVERRGGGGVVLPQAPRNGPFYCLADLTIEEVSLVNCFRRDRAPVEIWAELGRLQCEEISEGSAAL